MPHVRPIHVAALALLAATFTIEAAQATPAGVRPPSVSVPSGNIPRPSVRVDVPRDINGGRGGKSEAGGKPSKGSTPTASKPPEYVDPWQAQINAQINWYNTGIIAPQQKKVDDAYAKLQAAGAAMRNASDPENKNVMKPLRDRWEQLFSDWSNAQRILQNMKEKGGAYAFGRDPGDGMPAAEWIYVFGALGGS